MKRVLVFNLTPRLGMLHYSSQLCNELSKHVDLRVAIARYYDKDLYHKDIAFIKIRTNPNLKSFIFDTLSFWNHAIFLYKIVKFKPEIVHFVDNHPWYIFYSRLFKLLGCKIYVTQHDPTLHDGERTTLLGRVATKVNKTLRSVSDKIFVHGDKLKAEVIEKYGVDPGKVVSIVHGNYNFFKDIFSKGGEVEKNTFLFFGRIVDYKGLDLLLKSLFLVKKRIPNFKLIIAGPGDLSKYKDDIESLRNNLEIHNYDIELEEAYIYFERSEFVVLPYRDATGSGVIPVAYAFSKPVLVTNVGELPSAVENNATGLVIEKDSIEELAEKIIFMLENKEKAMDMGKKGREFSEVKLGWDGIVKKMYFE